MSDEKLVLALPKGRILDEVMPLVRSAGIEPEAAFDDPKSFVCAALTSQPSWLLARPISVSVVTMS